MANAESMTECKFVCCFTGCRYNTAPVCEDDLCPAYQECRACVSEECAKKNPPAQQMLRQGAKKTITVKV